MFGYLLVSNKNHVVLLDGNAVFKQHLWERIDKEIRFVGGASTSSGIYTDSSDSSPPLRSRRKQSTELLPLREVSHLFLPLISFYRASGITTCDTCEIIASDDTQIRFKPLSMQFFIICIGDCDQKQLSFLEYFQNCLETNLGPLIDLMDTDLLPVKNARDNVQLLLNRHCRGLSRRTKGYLDVRRTVFYKAQIEKVFPLLKSVCQQLHLFIGNNRCLLLSKGEVVASTNSSSDDKQLWKQLNMSDVHTLLDQLEAMPTAAMQGEISQFWLRSCRGQIPYYINVIRCRLTDHLVLVCLSEAKYDKLMRIIVLMLMQLEQLNTSRDIVRDSSEICLTVEELTKHLVEMVATFKDSHQPSPDTAFLRNPTKTANFLKSVWNRLHLELIRHSGEPFVTTKSRSRFSFSSFKSAISHISIGSSSNYTHSSKYDNYKEIPMKLDVLLTYWKRQMTTLLQELCNLAQREAQQYKLSLFQDSMRRIFRPNHEKMIHGLRFGEPDREEDLYRFLKPVDFRIDMLAYTFCCTDKNLSINFIPDHIREDIHEITTITNNGCRVIDIDGKSGTKYTLYQIKTNTFNHQTSSNSWLKSMFKRDDEISGGIQVSALFQSFVHKELAYKQIVCLSHQLYRHLQGVTKLYL